MPLKKFATKDEVPADQLADAIELKDGSFAIVEEPEPLGDNGKAALAKERKAAEQERKARETLERKVAEMESTIAASKAGITADEAKKWRDEQYALMRKEYETEIATIRTEADTAKAEARGLKLDNKVKATALKSGVLPGLIDDWWNLNGGQFDLDDSGEPTVKDGKGKAVDRFITDDLRKARPWMYQGTQASGGGTGGVQAGSPHTAGMSFEDFRKLSPAEQLTQARAMEKK